MKERVNWIDWAKALAVVTVVFCHMPQLQEWFYYRYLQSVIITVFFFLSGYLKRDRGSTRANWAKYWQGLIVPYMVYNVIVYPYWLLRFCLQNGGLPDLGQAMRPVIGALLFEYEGTFSELLNGPLWYLPSILFMHVLVDLCRKSRHQHAWLIAASVASVALYAANKYWLFLPGLMPMGTFRRLPYYYIGYVMGQQCLFRGVSPKRNAALCLGLMGLSILFFHWHLQAFYADQFLLHIALFYPVNILFLFGVLYGCKSLNGWRVPAITNLSVGTLVVIGLHFPVIGAVNYARTRFGGAESPIFYQWYEALIVAVCITALLYPIILLAKKRVPELIGRKRS